MPVFVLRVIHIIELLLQLAVLPDLHRGQTLAHLI